MPTGRIDLIEDEKYKQAVFALSELIASPEWQEAEKIWRLLTPEVWATYDMHGIQNLHEQRLLITALKNLKTLWRRIRPAGFFGRHIDETVYETANENTDQKDSSISDV